MHQNGGINNMLVSVSDNLPAYKINEHKNIVLSVASSDVEGDTFRFAAIQKAYVMAQSLGANAIINANLCVNVLQDRLEATFYGDAVVAEPLIKDTVPENKPVKINLSSYIPKQNDEETEEGEIIDLNGYKFAVCPKCKSKYKADVNEKGEIQIKGFDDTDGTKTGLQVHCLRCGAKFTVPNKIV